VRGLCPPVSLPSPQAQVDAIGTLELVENWPIEVPLVIKEPPIVSVAMLVALGIIVWLSDRDVAGAEAVIDGDGTPLNVVDELLDGNPEVVSAGVEVPPIAEDCTTELETDVVDKDPVEETGVGEEAETDVVCVGVGTDIPPVSALDPVEADADVTPQGVGIVTKAPETIETTEQASLTI
jgi:hypothetical protein